MLKSSAAEMNRALSVGGTTLDLQYINVNGESGAGGLSFGWSALRLRLGADLLAGERESLLVLRHAEA